MRGHGPETPGELDYRAGQFLTQAPASGVFIGGTAQRPTRATIGIESYYVQERTGHDYAQVVRSRKLWAEVALDGGGNPALGGPVIE